MTKRRRLQRDDEKERMKQKQTSKHTSTSTSVSLNARLEMIKMWRAESILNGIRPFELSQNGLTDFQTYRITDLHM
jgi:hypothetical protein